MANDHKRLLELALEALENKRREIDLEIAQVNQQLRGTRGKAITAPASKAAAAGGTKRKRNVRFTKEERKRRSERMRAYWINWRKQKKSEKS